VPAGSETSGVRGRRFGFAWAARAVAVLAAVAVFAATGYGWTRYRDLDQGIRRSDNIAALALTATPTLSSGPSPAAATQNLLVIGLDTRLDENGDPLPPAVYQAMDTGGPDVGGNNANVLMLLHIPGDGSRATAVSIPRDDYVELPGRPDGVAEGKIKQAYGLAFDQEHRALLAQGVIDKTTLEQRSRDAGRQAQIATVTQFLGVPVDHFVEVTLVAFYQIAQVVAPITVCLNEDTQDSYSGADFHRGYQQINAAQAVAFIRQRRDDHHPQLNFTDLDRERRQQAFIASLAFQLRQAGTLSDPARLSALIDVARQNIAVDPGLNLLDLAMQATALTSGYISFVTMPIVRFGTDPLGEDINIVDPAVVKATVQRLFSPAAIASTPPVDAAATAATAATAAGASAVATSPDRSASDDLDAGGIPCVN
jgi:LCP family protein required for cell wall assembly